MTSRAPVSPPMLVSVPALVGSAGAVEVLEPELEACERKPLLRSAGVLRGAWEML